MQTSVNLRREPIVLDSEGQQVIGIFHCPGEPFAAPHPAVALFHGFVGAKDQPHRLFVSLAGALAQVGIAALRIDFRGRGDSDGETIDITPEGDLADARAALDFLAAQPDIDPARLGVLGLSWGGAVAACLAGRDSRISAVVLWNAAAEVHEWNPPFEEFDGRRAVELWGNLVGEQFYEGVRHVFPLKEIRKTRGPILIVQSTADEAASDPLAGAERMRGVLAEAGVNHEVMLIEGADHAFMRHVWRQEAIDRTVAWLQKTLRP